MRLRLLALLLVARPASAIVDPQMLRTALVSELRALPGDDVGREASALLASSSVPLSIGLTGPGPDGRPATAIYAPGKGITIDAALARGNDAEDLARRLAPTIVHELEHARADLAVPGAPAALEDEWAAYAAEAAFVRRRAAAQPGYLRRRGLGRLGRNNAFTARAGKGGLDGVRRACERDGLFRGLKPATGAAAAYYRARLELLRAALASE